MIKLKKSDCKEILQSTFPEYPGRKFKVSIKEKYYIHDSYWDGGSRTFSKMIRLDGEIMGIPETIMGKQCVEGGEFIIPDNIMIVEHSFFCGKDCGITFVISPQSLFLNKMIQ